MMQLFITGSSSGIGKALAELALEEGHRVTGIARRHVIQHPDYRHLTINLEDPESYLKLNFNINKEAEKLVLVNNAGWLGEVKPLGRVKPESILRAFNINLTAPAVLSKMFIDQTSGHQQKRMIINISSGAGKYPVPSWSTYCASKAGIDLLTQVMALDHPDVKSIAVSPGIVDTAMQGEIRSVEQSDFPDQQRFVDYKEKGELASPATVAKKLMTLMDNPEQIPATVFSLRDVP